jgi:hypothetical protein
MHTLATDDWRVFDIGFDANVDGQAAMPTVVGWEMNDKHQLAPRQVDMSSSMDPDK